MRHPGLPDDPGHARAAAQMRNFGSMISLEFTDAGNDPFFLLPDHFFQQTQEVTIEIEGHEQPAVIAEHLNRTYL